MTRAAAADALEPAAVADAVAIATRYADAADRDRVLHPAVARALVTAGFARHFVPARWGGADGNATALLAAVVLLGRACPSAAWCGSLVAGAARMGVYLPEPGQAELWAEGPDVFVAGALVPSGRAEPVPGGWRLTGEWSFTSGVDYSGWALVASPAADRQDRPHFFAVPRHEYEVHDTWSSVGMRGTGSNTLALKDTFVAEHRAFDREQMLRGEAVNSSAACHVVPLRGISGILFGAPALGTARGALREWTASTRQRAKASGSAKAQEWSAAQTAARTATEIDAAELLFGRVAAGCDSAALTPDEVARNAYACAFAVDQLVGAVERLFRTIGTRGQLGTAPLQRYWRDIHALATHPALQLEPAGAAYGGHLVEV